MRFIKCRIQMTDDMSIFLSPLVQHWSNLQKPLGSHPKSRYIDLKGLHVSPNTFKQTHGQDDVCVELKLFWRKIPRAFHEITQAGKMLWRIQTEEKASYDSCNPRSNVKFRERRSGFVSTSHTHSLRLCSPLSRPSFWFIMTPLVSCPDKSLFGLCFLYIKTTTKIRLCLTIKNKFLGYCNGFLYMGQTDNEVLFWNALKTAIPMSPLFYVFASFMKTTSKSKAMCLIH